MRAARPGPDPAALWADIARPAEPSRTAGATMAGFRGWPGREVDLVVIPQPTVTLVVGFGAGPIAVEYGAGGLRHGSIAAGMAVGALRASARAVECVQVRLAPAAAHAVLGVPPDSLGRSAVTLEDLWGPDAARLEDRLRAAPSWEDRFAIVDAALARRRDAGRPVSPEVAFAWRRIVTSGGLVRVEGLAGETGWSRKRLWARFRSQTGLTPKRAAKLARFDHAVHRLAAGVPPARAAAETGYADQSHLHRDVRDFTAMTPSAVAAQPWLSVDDLAWPGGPGALVSR
jgi:AraC-like DNA-binding protein